jgi:hypothetical protein
MFKKSKLILSLIALLPTMAMTTQPMQSDEVAGQSNVEKKYKLSVCALFKNEAMYLKEWLEYHQMVGVDHFYLYDNGSRDGSRGILLPYIRNGIVTLTHWPDGVKNSDEENLQHWVLSTQLPAYENAIKRFAIHDSEWLAFLDIDEFLVPVAGNTVGEVLANYNRAPGVELVVDCFDASTQDPLLKKELLIANDNLTNRPEQNRLKAIEKTIFKPEWNTSFTWPPYKCQFKGGQSADRACRGELRINKYVNRPNGDLNFRKLKQKLHIDSRSLTEREKYELLEVGYEIEDKERVINRFEPGLRKRMGA